MPSSVSWYCGHCSHGPMRVGIDEHCVSCFRQKDIYATYEALRTSSINGQAYQSETPRDSIARCGRQTSGYYSNSNVLGRVQTFCYPQAATEKWYCCQCRDGPKTKSIEVKCVGCEHEICKNCVREDS